MTVKKETKGAAQSLKSLLLEMPELPEEVLNRSNDYGREDSVLKFYPKSQNEKPMNEIYPLLRVGKNITSPPHPDNVPQ